MLLKVGGVDLLPYLEERGIKWSRNDLDSAEAGRTMDGVMHRGRVATKIRLDLQFKAMKTEQLQTIMQLLYPEFVTVHYDDLLFGERSVKMYTNNISTTLRTVFNARTGLWDGFSVPLIER